MMKKILFLLLTLFLSLTGCKKDQKEPAKTPMVSTGVVSVVTATSFDCEGNVSSDGGSIITDRGVCYATTSAPTISDNKVSGGQGTGSFKVSINNLQQGKGYYVRAYATNSAGTAYGEERIVTLKKIVERITLSPTEKTVIEGERFSITATVLPADADNKAVTWRSSASDIASVDDQGSVTTHKPGRASITATTVDTGKTATCEVTVKSKITEEYKRLKGTAETIQGKVEPAKNELAGIKNANKTVNEKRKLVETLLQSIKSIKGEADSLRDEIEQKKDALYENEYAALKEKLQQLTSAVLDLQSEANGYKKKLDKAAREGKGDLSDLEVVIL
ncbi:Ig-like domain-containing protein [Porphyromonas cangingivalis]|uniref:Ig-like domain-containing protein n=1 Tax=Porphyromonas cangingivalis TaxID=36874 RepID=UPI0009E0854F|nr:Ig-like domain-containing protein [Porphyromonas cangingivalis]